LIQKLITERILVKGWYVYAASICFICFDLRLAKWWIEPQLSTSHKALMSRQLGKIIQKMENPNRPSTFFLGQLDVLVHIKGEKKDRKTWLPDWDPPFPGRPWTGRRHGSHGHTGGSCIC